MATISFMIPTSDIARVTEAARANGYDDPKMFVISAVKDAVYRYERARDAAAAARIIEDYDATYTPITPT